MTQALATGADVDHQLVEANGLRFHVATCGAGERLALFLHGFPECWYSWHHQLPMFARLGYRCWAPDLRGYGGSDKPQAIADYAIETLMDDVAGLIDAADAKSVTLVAHDWGAIIAWYFAMRRVRPLERLVIMNLPHPGAATPAFRTWKQRRKSTYALAFQIPWLPEKMMARLARDPARFFARAGLPREKLSAEAVAVFAEALGQPGAARAMLNYYRAFLRGGARRQRELGYPVIETPTLLLWGDDDVALGVETTHGTDRFVRDLTLRYLPGISHWVQQHDPETVNAMIEAWLAGRPVPEAAGARTP